MGANGHSTLTSETQYKGPLGFTHDHAGTLAAPGKTGADGKGLHLATEGLAGYKGSLKGPLGHKWTKLHHVTHHTGGLDLTPKHKLALQNLGANAVYHPETNSLVLLI